MKVLIVLYFCWICLTNYCINQTLLHRKANFMGSFSSYSCIKLWRWFHIFHIDALRDLVTFGQFKKHENVHGGVLHLVKLQANTPPWVFLAFFKLYKWYQIAMSQCLLNPKCLIHLIYLSEQKPNKETVMNRGILPEKSMQIVTSDLHIPNDFWCEYPVPLDEK